LPIRESGFVSAASLRLVGVAEQTQLGSNGSVEQPCTQDRYRAALAGFDNMLEMLAIS
jgi:hypothetical protein